MRQSLNQRLHFNPRSPRGGATMVHTYIMCHDFISIHAPHEGERLDRRGWHTDLLNFNPRSPRGGATCAAATGAPACRHFNPRSPRGGATLGFYAPDMRDGTFQSTLPTRGSDGSSTPCAYLHENFNPRSPRGGATHHAHGQSSKRYHFNPRSPRGGATIFDRRIPPPCGISIHAPHEGERHAHAPAEARGGNFNPRSPRGGATRSLMHMCVVVPSFQSTLPTRGSDPDFAIIGR